MLIPGSEEWAISSASWFHDPRFVTDGSCLGRKGFLPIRSTGEVSSAGGENGFLPAVSTRLVVGILVNNKRAYPLVFS